MRKTHFLKMTHSLHQEEVKKMKKTGMKEEDMPKKYDIERAYDKTIKIVSDPGGFSKEPKSIGDLTKNQDMFFNEFVKQIKKLDELRIKRKRPFIKLFMKYSQTNAKKYEVEKAYNETIINIPNPAYKYVIYKSLPYIDSFKSILFKKYCFLIPFLGSLMFGNLSTLKSEVITIIGNLSINFRKFIKFG